MSGLLRNLYPDGRPNKVARTLNRVWQSVSAWGLWPDRLATLEVTGRKSGKTIALPVVIGKVEGERYLVSMLGDQAQWVQNVRAAGGKALLRSGWRKAVRLEEVATSKRAPILKRYLQVALGARPHVKVDKDAPLSAFEAVAADYPVFHAVPLTEAQG